MKHCILNYFERPWPRRVRLSLSLDVEIHLNMERESLRFTSFGFVGWPKLILREKVMAPECLQDRKLSLQFSGPRDSTHNRHTWWLTPLLRIRHFWRYFIKADVYLTMLPNSSSIYFFFPASNWVQFQLMTSSPTRLFSMAWAIKFSEKIKNNFNISNIPGPEIAQLTQTTWQPKITCYLHYRLLIAN